MGMEGAFIVPHPPVLLPEVGKGREQAVIRTAQAYKRAMEAAAALRPDTVILTSPHAVLYADYFHISPGGGAKGDFGAFGAPSVTLEASYDGELRDAICRQAARLGLPAGTQGEKSGSLDHGTMLPLWFLNQFTTGYKLIRLGLSGLSLLTHYRLGQCIRRACEETGKRAVFIASGDLSHKLTEDGPYGFAPEGPEFDRQVTDAMKTGDFLRFLTFSPSFRDRAAECGLGSFAVMAGALDGVRVKSDFLSYEGTFGVGYAVCCFYPEGEEARRCFGEVYAQEERKRRMERKDAEDDWVRLARKSLEAYIKTGRIISIPGGLPAELYEKRAGAFVSVKKDGQLRGCIGTITACMPSLAEEIIQNAVSAGTGDPRFAPVTEDELEALVYSVDVLGETQPAQKEDLDVKRYGVIVTSGRKRGLLLPNLDGVDTVEEQIAIARQKAGIRPEEEAELERFEVVRHI